MKSAKQAESEPAETIYVVDEGLDPFRPHIKQMHNIWHLENLSVRACTKLHSCIPMLLSTE